LIIDAHLHLPTLSEERSAEQAKEILLGQLGRSGVDACILIPDNIPDSNIGDFDTCRRLFADVDNVFLLYMINIDQVEPDDIAYFESLIVSKQIVGLKIIPGHDPFYPNDPRLDPVYALCEAHQFPMMIHTGWNPGHPEVALFNDPKYIVDVAERYPNMPIVIAHFFWPEMEYCYDLTHSYPNISYDTSGLATKTLINAIGEETIRRVVLELLEGDLRRIIFGTDYAMCNIDHHVDFVRALPVADNVKEGILWRNAMALFKLPGYNNGNGS
jgi:uncharacterized protein